MQITVWYDYPFFWRKNEAKKKCVGFFFRTFLRMFKNKKHRCLYVFNDGQIEEIMVISSFSIKNF